MKYPLQKQFSVRRDWIEKGSGEKTGRVKFPSPDPVRNQVACESPQRPEQQPVFFWTSAAGGFFTA